MVKKTGLYESLHFHTRNSDGSWTYPESLARCAQYGVGVVAFTDHDALPGREDLGVLKQLQNHPVKYILGVELTVSHVRELEESVPLFHVVGLFVDPREKFLRDYCRQRQAGRLVRARRMVTNLQKMGFKIGWSEVATVKKGLSVGRPHIVKALLQHQSNQERAKKLIKELGLKPSPPAFLEKYRALLALPRLEFQLYPLFFTELALVPGVYVPYEENLDMDAAVHLIRRTGGLSFLAHWSFSRLVLNPSLVKKIAKEKRIDGVETVYGLNSRERFLDIKEDFVFLKNLAKETGLLVSGGGDIHQEGDLRIFSRNPLSRQTRGMAEAIIEGARPNLTWTSFGR